MENADLKKLQEENLQLQKDKADLLTANEGLQSALAETEKQLDALNKGGDVSEVKPVPKIPEKTFKVDKVEYKFLVPQFHHNRQLITAEQALAMPDLLKELVEMGVKIISPAKA